MNIHYLHGIGRVSKILADDVEGSRHQRFIITLAHGQTLLIVHNIDLSKRISGLRLGDNVEFYGVYKSNRYGGLIHWTHKNRHQQHHPHQDGWLKHHGVTYQ